MEDRQQPRERPWDDDTHQVRVGSEWCIWRHTRLETEEAPTTVEDIQPPENIFPIAGLEYQVSDPIAGFTSGRVTQVHCTDEECVPVPNPLQAFDDWEIFQP